MKSEIRIRVLLALALVLVAASTLPRAVTAQIPWESPQLLGPGSPDGLTLAAMRYGMDPNSGLGGMLIMRTGVAPNGIGIRVGAAHGIGNRMNVAGGVDFARMLLRKSNEFPLDLMLTYGAGASWGEYLQIALPVGISGGRMYESPTFRFNPYTSARAVAEGHAGHARPRGDVTVALAIDVGADLTFGSARNFTLRTGASLGDRQAVLLGLHLGGSGRTSSAHKQPVR
jgi:hypothetical protein